VIGKQHSRLRGTTHWPNALLSCLLAGVAILGSLLGTADVMAASYRCSDEPTQYAARIVTLMSQRDDPQIIMGELAHETRDSVSTDDITKLERAFRTKGRGTLLFRGPILEDVSDGPWRTDPIRAQAGHAQIGFVLESAEGSGLNKLTFLLLCVEPRWYIAGIRLTPFDP
jgi:hypothetical protein